MGSGPPGYIRTRTHVAALGRAWPQGSTTGPELHRRGAFNTERASDSLISRPRNHPLALPELRPPTRGKLPDRQRGSPRHRVLDLLAPRGLPVVRACARHGVLPRNRGKAQYLRDRNALQRRRWASAIWARPAFVLGPADIPP